MSRKIDALIAEHVMDIKTEYLPNAKMEYDYCEANTGDRPKIKYYSTDIAAAWEVVEKLAGVESGCGYCVDISFDGGWIVNIGNHNSTDAKTAPMAICLAALKARGVEVDDG